MSDFDYRLYLYESIRDLEERVLSVFGCWYFTTAYRCRVFLRSKGYSDVLTVRTVGGVYLPMTREIYCEWRRLNRQLKKLNDN